MEEATNNKIKVVYLAGSGRSGSTILNIILDNHPDIFGGGEIQNIGAVFNDEKVCSCGEKMVECDFWSKVTKNWLSKVNGKSVRQESSKWMKMEYWFSPIAWIRVWLGFPIKSQRVKNYFETTYNYFNELRTQSQKSVILDISKNPLRAWALMQHPQIDLRLIHLVRDGRGVAWSLKKTEQRQGRKRPIWRAAMFWLIVNRLAKVARRRNKNSILVKYEDFAKNPKEIIKKIGSMAEINVRPITKIIESNGYFKISHVMAGNGIRKGKEIQLRFNDDEWIEKLKPHYQKKFYSIARTTMRKYNYPANRTG